MMAIRDWETPAEAVVAIAASAGGLTAISRLLRDLPAELNAAVLIVLHRSASKRSMLQDLLRPHTRMRLKDAEEGERIHRGVVYIAPPDRHMMITAARRIHLMDGARIRFTRSSANPLFESAAKIFGDRAIVVVLTGGDSDGTDGVQTVASRGGVVIAQDPESAHVPAMPASAIKTGAVQYVLPLEQIAPCVARVVGSFRAAAAAT